MAETDQEKTEDASERRIQQAREEGRVATSKELVAAIGVIAGGGTLFAAMPFIGSGLTELVNVLRARALGGELTSADVTWIASTVAVTVGPPVLLVLAAAGLAMAVSGSAITGFNIAPAALEPKPDRLDPIAAAQNQFFSWQPWVQLLKGTCVAAFIAWAAWGCIRDHLDAIPVLGTLGPRGQVSFLGDLVFDFAQRVGPVVLAIGVADFAWQKFNMARQMKMTKEEVKQEHKEQEGDPKVKARRRQRARQIAMQSQLPRVKDADVVIVNPTHYAIALRYRRDENAAPMVVARGVDHLALLIRAEANRHEIPIIENRPLARALHARCRFGLPIPAEFFGPVAQVLAVVYRQRRAAAPAVSRPGSPR